MTPIDSDSRPRRTSVTDAKPKSAQSTVSPGRDDETPRRQAVKALLGVALMPLGTIATAQQIRYPEQVSPFTLDVDTIARHSDVLAGAVEKVADSYPVVGVILDRVGQVAPISELVSAVFTIGIQIAENHGKLPAGLGGNIPGIIDRQSYASELMERAVSSNGSDPAS
jgi:hypothetical protein